ncbi:MAG: hypothetical protein IJO29_05390 [Oscillospiraceae bacterium]|nr:hypothetical protein [Oscillospiraceae bacterium]
MLCNKCGIDMGNSAVCPNCGAPAAQNAVPAQNAAPVAAGSEAAPANFDIKKYLPVIGIAAAVIVVIILLVSLLGGGGSGKAEKLLKKEFKAIVNEDVEAYLELQPDYMIDYYKDLYGKSDYEDSIEDNLADSLEYIEDEVGKDVKITYNVLDSRKMTEDELEDVEDNIKDYYDEKVDVKAGYYGVYEVTAKGDDEKVESYSTFKIVKIDGKWCIYSGGLY